jgi:hypothetical protein
MTEISMALLQLLRKHGLENDVDFLDDAYRIQLSHFNFRP